MHHSHHSSSEHLYCLEKGLCVNEMQVFKLWLGEDLNSADTSELPSMCILKPLPELPVSCPSTYRIHS